MRELSEDEKSLLRDLLNSHGWKILIELNNEAAKDYRFMATGKSVSMEDRLWYSALALGREELIESLKNAL